MSPQGIILFVFVGASLLFAAVAAGLSGVFLVELWRVEQVRRRRALSRAAFLRRLLRRLGAMRDIADVHDAYRAFFGVAVMRSSHLEDVSEFLQQAMRRLTAGPQEPSEGKRHAKIESLQELLAANGRALEVERMCVPFSGTPEPERGALEELLDMPAGDGARAAAKLDILAKAIRSRQDTLDRLGEQNIRALRLARWGWYVTMALAVLTGILGLICLGV
jgi:hypothetical protein